MAELLQFPPPAQPSAPLRELPSTPTLELADTPARLAALDIHRSWIVEAPAGSGKTGLLIQRYLKLLAHGEVERPSEVLAITFTRKAAQELRTRVLEQLTAAARDQALPATAGSYEQSTRQLATEVLRRDAGRGWHLIESPHQLNIRTIDAFCSELAGSLPLLSGGAGRGAPLEDAAPLYEEAARRVLLELGGHDQSLNEALRTVLLHRDGQIADCIRLLADMLAAREQWGALIPLEPQTLTEEELDGQVRRRLERTLERIVCEGLSHAGAIIGPDLLSELGHLAARLSTEPGYNGNPSPLVLCRGMAHAPGIAATDHEHWLALLHLLFTAGNEWRSGFAKNHLGFELPKAEKAWLKELIERLKIEEGTQPNLKESLCEIRFLPSTTYPDDQWAVAKALFRVLRRALAELTVLFEERRACDFSEMALLARRLLQSDTGKTDLLQTPGAQLRHLLVDEMQDTSAGQYELIEMLTRYWDGGTQTLFLVGDPKQSIYAFRQARVERFLRTQTAEHLGDVPLGALRLTANFRSQRELVTQFNQTFGLVLPTPAKITVRHAAGRAELTAVPFVAATATRPQTATPALHWHTRLLRDPTLADATARERSPEACTFASPAEEDAYTMRTVIEAFTAHWQARPSAMGANRPPRIAVLARSRAHLAPVIAEFQRDRGPSPLGPDGSLPFRAVDIELLNERPEILDLLALTRALLHPGDRVAWLAVLRSPVCGLGRADLLALTGEGPDAQTSATVAHLVSTRTHLLSPDGQQLLHRAWPVLAEAQASHGRTPLSTHVERTWRSLGADAPLKPEERANADRFLHLLREMDAADEPLTLQALNRRLRKLYAEPSSAPATVELLTIHKAKGLEWDLVLIPALERATGITEHELLKWLELDTADSAHPEVILAPIAGKGDAASQLSAWLSRLQRRREREEAKRLFYVACTRAREELHLFATASMKKAGELAQPEESSLLRASWAAAEPVFGRLLTEEADTSRPRPVPIRPPQIVEDPQPFTLALAASGENSLPPTAGRAQRTASLLHRLPLSFDPLARFRPEGGPQLPYVPASALRHEAPFTRPEGSFAARAFGNGVHRFLELLSRRLQSGMPQDVLLRELPTWQGRLLTTFRAEGLPPAICERYAARTLQALQATLADPVGAWLLSPQTGAQSEQGLHFAGGPSNPSTGTAPVSLRADRLFLAGADPLSTQAHTHLWIVDFKTAERGGRTEEAFFAAEKAKYQPQMQIYAQAAAAMDGVSRPTILALYYPLLPHLVYWPYEAVSASEYQEDSR